MTLHWYHLTVKHDHGKAKFKLVASSEESAREMLCNAELCPDRAITNVKQGKKI